ncbi:MAG: hypothetical protein JWN75_918 [Candidatus Saccharibacteria bacterium]|nr:hypothetical protein [Candidatus Saccharibacteria bacterium]
MIYRIVSSIVLALVSSLLPLTVQAAQPKDRGLSISPLRQEMTASAITPTAGSFTITNLTEKVMKVNLSVRQFSVSDYDYDYVFRTPEYDWIALRNTRVDLEPRKSMKIAYDVTIPAGTTPGGYYFALFASTDIVGPGLPGTVQAASLLYMRVEGKLVRTSVLQNDSIPWLVTGSEIPYKFDVKDTGNVDFSAYFYGQVQGLFGIYPEVGTSHLLMPGAIRTVEGAVPSPVLPGIYRVTYGYKVDFAQIITSKTAYVLFIPPWSVAALVFALLAGRWLWQQKKKRSEPKKVS